MVCLAVRLPAQIVICMGVLLWNVHCRAGRFLIECALSFREYTGSDPVRGGVRRRMSAVVVRLRRTWLLPVLRQCAHRPVPLHRVHLRQVRFVYIHARRVAMLSSADERLKEQHGHGTGVRDIGRRGR